MTLINLTPSKLKVLKFQRKLFTILAPPVYNSVLYINRYLYLPRVKNKKLLLFWNV